MTLRHLLTIDVESTGRAYGDNFASDAALAPALVELLQMLARLRVRAVFFVLASELSALATILCQALKAGHEIGAHGLVHKRVDGLGPVAFREDIREAKRRVEDALQHPCVNYRAPWFSAPPPLKAGWFFDALESEGFSKDFSMRLPLAAAARFRPDAQSIREHPVPIVSIGVCKLGVLGGMALRVLPKLMIGHLMQKVIRKNVSACLYLHPYEWYPSAAAANGARRGFALARTLPRLEWLLSSMAFEKNGEA